MGDVPCPACASREVQSIDRVGPVPVLCGSLWDSSEEARATPNADLDLALCRTCAHVWNTGFDPTLVDYDAKYDNALDFSPTFRRFADELIARLVDRFDLRGKTIAEIGSGKGEFLRALCAAGGNRGIGYDPTYEGKDREGDVEFVRQFFGPTTVPDDVDFVACRHVLEHVSDPVRFLMDIRAALRGRAVPVYIEVPNAEFNFAESGPWDLIYPHVGYFNAESLRAALNRAGFRVVHLEPVFGAQFLAAEAVPEPGVRVADAAKSSTTDAPRDAFRRALSRQLAEAESWRSRLGQLREGGGVAVWGAGSKGVTFLSLADPEHRIDAVVDANPRKRGRFLPGSGRQVLSPEDLLGLGVRTVLVMNPVYAGEIGASLEAMGVSGDVIVV